MGSIKDDQIGDLRACLRTYHQIERDLITTNPTLFESDTENYTDSYKWMRLPTLDEHPEMVLDMKSLGVEDFPNDFLAGILVEVLKNQVSKGVLFSGLGIDKIGNSFHFCISGSTSLEELQNLYEQFEQQHGIQDEK